MDTLSYQGSAVGVTVSLVDGSSGSGGDAQGDTLTGFENVRGSDVKDTLTGNALSNILVGRGGADLMAGGDGDDWYDVDNAGDMVLELSNAGTDTIWSSVDLTLGLGNSIEKMAAFATAGSIDLAGNAIVQSIQGNTANNRITGGGGGDILYGGGGNDVFDYDAVADSTSRAGNVDTVRDFASGDLIDLQDVFGGILTFVGTGAYSGAAGEVRFTAVGADAAVIRVNLDGDLDDEMRIVVNGTNALTATDFVL